MVVSNAVFYSFVELLRETVPDGFIAAPLSETRKTVSIEWRGQLWDFNAIMNDLEDAVYAALPLSLQPAFISLSTGTVNGLGTAVIVVHEAQAFHVESVKASLERTHYAKTGVHVAGRGHMVDITVSTKPLPNEMHGAIAEIGGVMARRGFTLRQSIYTRFETTLVFRKGLFNAY